MPYLEEKKSMNQTRSRSPFKEFFAGVKTLFQGFVWFRTHPKTMLYGLIPAGIVGLVLSGLIILLAINIPLIVDFLSGFSDDWLPALAVSMKIAIGAAIIGGATFLSAVSFTALTLMIGDSFYTEIWKEVEFEEFGRVPDHEPTFIEGLKDSMSLLGRGLLVGLLAFTIGLIPFVGGFLGAIVGFSLAGYILADELTARSMNARAISGKNRRSYVKKNFARSVGFGVATQLCFLIPLGAIFAMPATVVGSANLARHIGDLR